MYNAIIDQVFLDQSCSMLSIFEYRLCVADSSPVMADKKEEPVCILVRNAPIMLRIYINW